jgi:hypothetical protein
LAAGNYHDFSPTHVEDYDLWLRMAAMNLRLANLPEALVNYRIHQGSTTQKSIAAKRLDAEMLRRLQEAAPRLYGCSAGAMTRLKRRTHPLAAVALTEIARHLQTDENPWKSDVFYRAARQMIAPFDLLSRLIVATKAHGWTGGIAEIGAITSDLVRFAARPFRKVSGH